MSLYKCFAWVAERVDGNCFFELDIGNKCFKVWLCSRFIDSFSNEVYIYRFF